MISKNSILLIGAILSLAVMIPSAYADDDDYAKQENRIDELFEKLEKLLIEQEVIAEELRGYGIFADDDTEALEEWQLKDDSPSRTKRCADDCPKTMKIRAAYEYPRWCLLTYCHTQHIKGDWSANVNAQSADVEAEILVKAERTNITPYFITASETRPVHADYQIGYLAVDDHNTRVGSHGWESHNSFFKWYFDETKGKETTVKASLEKNSSILFDLDVVGLR